MPPGAIVPDLPLEEAEPVREVVCRGGAGVGAVGGPDHAGRAAGADLRGCPGFVYVVSTVGTTGERDEMPAELAELVSATKAEAEVPVAVGFGIGTPDQAAQVGEVADGVIIGSRLVRAAGEADGPECRRRGGRLLPARDARRTRLDRMPAAWEW